MKFLRSFEMRIFGAFLGLSLMIVVPVAMLDAQTPPAPLSIKIATSPQAATAEAYVALDIGTFKKYGLDAQVESHAKGAGSAVAAIVISKAADVGEADMVAVCAAAEHGIPLSLLAPSNVYFPSSAAINVLAVAANSTIHTAKDLDGKTLAAPSLEGPAKLSAAKWLDDHGADLSTVKFIELPVASMPAALETGTIAAGMLSEPALTTAGDAVRILGRTYQEGYGRTFQVSYWFATPEFVKANPEIARRFALAMRDTALWTNDPKNAERYGQILQKYAHFPDDVVKKMGRANYGLVVDTSLAQPLIDAAIKYKSLHKDCPAKDFVAPTALVAR
jgi:NitT/TauT family transport system substrate-binding protein